MDKWKSLGFSRRGSMTPDSVRRMCVIYRGDGSADDVLLAPKPMSVREARIEGVFATGEISELSSIRPSANVSTDGGAGAGGTAVDPVALERALQQLTVKEKYDDVTREDETLSPR